MWCFWHRQKCWNILLYMIFLKIYLGMSTTPLLLVLVQFWDHFITYTFLTLVLKSGLTFALGPSESALLRIFCFWAHFPPSIASLFFQNQECIENLSWLYFSFKIREEKNIEIQKKFRVYWERYFWELKCEICMFKLSVKFEISMGTMGPCFFLSTVFNHFASVLLSALAK